MDNENLENINQNGSSLVDNKILPRLTETQFLAIQLLATGKSGKAVAQTLDVAEETISGWRQLPHFRKSLNEFLLEIRRSSATRLTALVTSAVDAIEAGFNDPSISTRDRFIMGIKFLELCRRHEIEPKVKDISEDEDIRKIREITLAILAKRKENEKNVNE